MGELVHCLECGYETVIYDESFFSRGLGDLFVELTHPRCPECEKSRTGLRPRLRQVTDDE